MAFYHDPKLQTHLQYHFLPTEELQQQRKQQQLLQSRHQSHQHHQPGDDEQPYQHKKKKHPGGIFCYPHDINFQYNDSYNWRVLEKFHGWKKVKCGGKASKTLKDGCKYCPPKGRMTAGGTPTYRVSGVEGVDWFSSMEDVLRFLKNCERRVVAFPTTRGPEEQPLNWILEAQKAEAAQAKQEAREAAAAAAAEAEGTAAAAAALEAWEEAELRSGDMTIFSMAREGDVPILGVFLESDPSLIESRKETSTPDAGATPLLCAARAGQLETVRFLIERGADVGARDYKGLGALHYAAMRDRSEVAALLLAAGADPVARDDTEFGYTPLHVCVHYDAKKTIAVLLHQAEVRDGGGINAEDYRDGFSPLMLATVRDAKDTAVMLLKAGADVLSKDKFQIPVLLKAYFRHGFDILEALVAAGGLTVATKFEPRDRHTLACFAARDGRTELLARLHRQVGLQNIDAHTCCGVGIGHHAAESANTRAMEWLARDLPAMNTRFNDEAAAATILTAHAKRWPGMLPLHVAASLGQKEHVQLLLTSPALGPLEGRARLLSVKDNYDYTVLEGAACRYKPFVVMGLYLWRLRAKVQAAGDKVPAEGTQAFHRGWAAAALLKDRHPEKLAVVEYLLENWGWYFRRALPAQEQDRENPRPISKWIETAATNADVRAVCSHFLADAKAVAANPSHPAARRDVAKKREMEAADARARAQLQALKANNAVMAELPPPPVINVDDIDTALAPPLPTPPAIAPSSSFSSSLSQPAPTAAPIHSTPASLGVMTEDELLKQALALSREEHGREQQRRAMATMPPVQMPPAPAPRMQAGVVDMRTLEAQMAAAGIGYEVEYGSDDDLPTVSAAGVASASASASAARPPPLAAPSLPPVPSFVSTSSSSLFSAAPAAPDAAAKAALGRIQPPPSHAFAPPPPAPVLPGLEPGYGDEDEGDGCDGEDDDEPPTDLTCPIKFMLLLDPVVAMDGHTYSRQGLEEWFERCRSQGNPITSPLAGHEMSDMMINNHNVKARAVAWMDGRKAKGRPYRIEV